MMYYIWSSFTNIAVRAYYSCINSLHTFSDNVVLQHWKEISDNAEVKFDHDVVHAPAILVPGLDLGISEVQFGRQLHPVLNAEVLLTLEA